MSLYVPTPKEQFYLNMIGAVCLGIAGISWPLGAPAWVTVLSAIAGVIAMVLHEAPSVASQLPASVMSKTPQSSIATSPIPIVTSTASTSPMTTVIATTPTRRTVKLDPIMQV